MEMLINVQSNQVGEIVRETAVGKVLLVNGIEKEYAASTLRRWWKSYTPPVVETVPEVVVAAPAVSTPVTEIPAHFTADARILINQAIAAGCTYRVTPAYVGLVFNKKTVMEVHCSKTGKVKVVVNSTSLPEAQVTSWVNHGYAKLAPASYGWTLDFTVPVQNVTTSSLLELLDKGIEFRR